MRGTLCRNNRIVSIPGKNFNWILIKDKILRKGGFLGVIFAIQRKNSVGDKILVIFSPTEFIWCIEKNRP